MLLSNFIIKMPTVEVRSVKIFLIFYRKNECCSYQKRSVFFQTSDLYVPAAQEISGDCDKSDEANIVISWAGYDWTIYFSKVIDFFFWGGEGRISFGRYVKRKF